ncbi:NADPH-dependent ferric siderophore reductase [Hoeflea marina]|uniref:NADPH-dependent ferric siderophore reductase n=1 Tax=Hoeflea marina TaxID=274592 RepID=A0A317PXB6_9HYPH|nr:DUF2218 domain-containing protein [Hoeflea marina]PWW04140.1 NADPH-dependent ferric siderophore reductase [Hoeflea marina]
MTGTATRTLSGIAVPHDALAMLDEICEHFIEHSRVERDGDFARLTSEIGVAGIRALDGKLIIDLSCPSEEALQMSCNSIAEHLFYFAGDEPMELQWSEPAAPAPLPNLHECTVVSSEDVTPRMRRVKLACSDIAPFVGGGMHVRLLVPPRQRTPVWPSILPDGRTGWPEGEDELLVRVYTIRAVDAERGELWVDFVQHGAPGEHAPGAGFARTARPGDRVALIGPGGGDLPQADHVLLAGDESALPAIARIAAEIPAGTRLVAIIEVEDEAEEQPLPSKGTLEVRWLHRKAYPADAGMVLASAVKAAVVAMGPETYVWVGCEKEEIRSIRSFLKQRGHAREKRYVAWYWERDKG